VPANSPGTARVLFTPPVGEPDLLAESQRVQADATAGIAALLAAERGELTYRLVG
jgi:hypothetical protein